MGASTNRLGSRESCGNLPSGEVEELCEAVTGRIEVVELVLSDVVGSGVKVAETVTSLFGIMNAHTFTGRPLAHVAPVILQLINAPAGVAVTVTVPPTVAEQPVGQLGTTVPEPAATFVNKVGNCVKVAFNVATLSGIVNLQGLEEHATG